MERNLAQEFERRLDSRIDELKGLYSQLYHGDEKALADLLAMLRRAYEERGMSLCLDFVMNHSSEDHEWACVGAAF